MTTSDLYQHRARWQHHSAAEREALAELALAITSATLPSSPSD